MFTKSGTGNQLTDAPSGDSVSKPLVLCLLPMVVIRFKYTRVWTTDDGRSEEQIYTFKESPCQFGKVINAISFYGFSINNFILLVLLRVKFDI